MTSAPPPRSAYRPDWLCDVRGFRLSVLGAEGFIGSHLVRVACEGGADVRAICVRPPWRLTDLEGVDVLRVTRWWERDLEVEAGGCDAIVVLAYDPPPPGGRSLEHERRVNRDGVVRAAKACRHVVFASSADVYGPWHDDPVDESTPLDPATPYALAKVETERALEGAAILRLASVYGPGELGPRAIPSFLRALLDDGRPVVRGDDVRDLVHVVDVAAALLNAAALGRPAVLNIGSGSSLKVSEILETVQRVLGTDVEPRRLAAQRPPSRLVLDPTAARSTLGFRPREDFTAALREEADWLRAWRDAQRPAG